MPKINIDGPCPCMGNWVTLKRVGEKIIARNGLLDEEIELTEREAKYLTKLNGNRKKDLIKGFSLEECERYYQYLDSCFLIREPGRKMEICGEKIYTLFIPQKKSTNSVIPKILNFLLWTSFLPVFLYGVYRMRYFYDFMFCTSHWLLSLLLGNTVGLLIGMIAHEFAHGIACLSNKNGRLYEAGIVKNGLVCGAYVMIDDSQIKSTLKKVQINLAGVEMNLLISGLLLIVISSICRYNPMFEWNTVMFLCVIQNVFMALINISFYEGLDGEHIISCLMGGFVVDMAKANLRLLKDCKKRKRYFKQNGINGIVNMFISFVIMGFQLITPLLFIAAVLAFIGGLFL